MKSIIKNNKFYSSITLICILLFVSGIVFQGCQQDNGFLILENDYLDNNYDFKITKEAEIMKHGIKNQIESLKFIVDNNYEALKNARSTDDIIENELLESINDLSLKSLNMLQSYGIDYTDIEKYVESVNDPRIAILGVVFIHLIEQNTTSNISIPRLRSASETEGTYSYGQVMDCLGRVFLGVNLGEFIASGATKFTLSTALGIAGRVASRTLGVAAAAIAVADFGDCMGWYNLW